MSRIAKGTHVLNTRKAFANISNAKSKAIYLIFIIIINTAPISTIRGGGGRVSYYFV
jgi:hypothetical protein